MIKQLLGGVIFPVALLLAYFLFDFQYTWFVASVLILSVVSFLDDLYSLSNRIRFFVQFLAVFLLLFELDLIQLFWFFPVLFFVLIGGLNAFNFMDGINGITALYSMIALSSLYYINLIVQFIDSEFILIPLLAVNIFSFLNIRKRALCFAGDVGSISIAAFFVLMYWLVIHTQNYFYLILLLVYALDSGATILKKKVKRKIFSNLIGKHLYQQLVHIKELSHLQVSFLFAAVQLVINFYAFLRVTFIGCYLQYSL